MLVKNTELSHHNLLQEIYKLDIGPDGLPCSQMACGNQKEASEF